jgi:peptidoglycan/xylan/chitin deacetylase (PgdA/CDA1 family)
MPPTVYLTIDDGPNPVGTPKVLAILRREHVRVTFFVIGMHAAAYPDLLRAMYREGNAIGDHTWDHDYALCYRSPEAALADFDHAAWVIHQILGIWPHIARAPGGTWGNFTPETFRLLAAAGYRVYNWNASVGDSSLAPVPPAVELARVEAQTRGTGPYIVLMHDDHPNTVAALPAIIQYFRRRGFRFGLLTDPDVPKSLEATWVPFKYAPWVGGTGLGRKV